MSDATEVTGSFGGRAPRKGDVLGERYEVRELLSSDALVCTYRGVDQESDAPVLLRCTAPGIIGVKDARRIVERLKPLVGAGGRILSPLRDVDCEGAMVFTVEGWPRGTSLRAVLQARRGRGGTLEPREVLPVVARLSAAIASIPEPFWHGDVRTERVWVDSDALVLTGGLLISSLPGDAVAAALRRDGALRRCYAPEVADGLGDRPSDRWGVGAIAWEALTGRAVEPGLVTPPRSLGAASPWLAKVLHPDPALRPPTLEGLIAALADIAGLPVPRVEPEPFPVREPSPPPGDRTEVTGGLVHAPTDLPPGLGDPLSGRLPLVDTVEMSLDDQDDTRTNPTMPALRGDHDTAPHAALGPDGKPFSGSRGAGMDPRLVRAALAEPEGDAPMAEAADEAAEMPDGATDPKSKGDELDPRLVRAALGVSLEDSRPKPVSPPVAASQVAPRKSPDVTSEIDALELEPIGSPPMPAASRRPPGAIPPPVTRATSPKRPASPASASSVFRASRDSPPPGVPPGRRKPVKPREPVPLPKDIKPIPRPRVDIGDIDAGPVLYDASRPVPPVVVAPAAAPAPRAMAPTAPAPDAHADAARLAASMPRAAVPASPPIPQAPAPTRVPRASTGSRWVSWLIIGVAMLVAAAIVAAGFWYRARLQREEEHQRMIQERLRAIQSGRIPP